MSELKVVVAEIDKVEKLPKADRLDGVTLKGMAWCVVTGRNEDGSQRYKPGDRTIYCPIDSALPKDLEEYLFPEGSVITLKNSRIRTEKIRGSYSQGMCIDFTPELLALRPALSKVKIGDDVTKILGIVKYEPPISSLPKQMNGIAVKRFNTNFKEYTDIQNIKNYDKVFKDGEPVVISEKLHGSSGRFSCLPVSANTLWKKVLKFFGLLPKFEYCYGSRRVQLQIENKNNIWSRISKQYNIEDILAPGEALYGEIIGSGIQGGYTYGCKEGEIKFTAYDVSIDGNFLNPTDFIVWCNSKEIPHVPVLGIDGKKIDTTVSLSITLPYSWELVTKLTLGDSTIGNQKVREGIVIKPLVESNVPSCGRKVLKFVSDDYLHKESKKENSTDFH